MGRNFFKDVVTVGRAKFNTGDTLRVIGGDFRLGAIVTVKYLCSDPVAYERGYVMNESMYTFKESELELVQRLNQLTIKDIMVEANLHATKAGFYEDGIPSLPLQIALMHSEVSEALEADRKNLGNEAITEEFADVIIRICDACQVRGFDLEGAIASKIAKNKNREYKHGGKKY